MDGPAHSTGSNDQGVRVSGQPDSELQKVLLVEDDDGIANPLAAALGGGEGAAQ